MSGCLRVMNRESEADMLEPIGTERETPVRRRRVQERIRLGRKNEGCRVPGENAAEPANLRESPRKIGEPKVKAKRPRQTVQAHAMKRELRAERSATARTPSTCSSRGFGSRIARHGTAAL